jgi:hypothetical protein
VFQAQEESSPVHRQLQRRHRHREPRAARRGGNACSRIESTVCKPGEIVCSRATLDRTKKSFNATSLGTVSLRGRQAEMEVFEIN